MITKTHATYCSSTRIHSYYLATCSFLLLVFSITSSFGYLPKPKNDINDNRGLMGRLDDQQLERLIKEAREKHGAPIVVCTINSMHEYAHKNTSIEAFTQKVFNDWQIGTTNSTDGANKGILLLVSYSDRKARIELGEDWGWRWDAHCEKIMDRHIIPEFKNSNYSKGILNGAKALSRMAKHDPSKSPPRPSLKELFGDISSRSKVSILSPIPGLIVIFLVVLGVGILVMSIFGGEARGVLFVVGAGCVLAGSALLVFVAVVILYFIYYSLKNGSGGG